MAERSTGEKVIKYVEVGGFGFALAGLLLTAPALAVGGVLAVTGAELAKRGIRKGK